MTVAPIRPDVTPAMDAGREMMQLVAEKINEYIADNGYPPESLAFVLVGPDDGDAVTVAHSWSPLNEGKSRLHCCAVASAVLMQRAVGL